VLRRVERLRRFARGHAVGADEEAEPIGLSPPRDFETVGGVGLVGSQLRAAGMGRGVRVEVDVAGGEQKVHLDRAESQQLFEG